MTGAPARLTAFEALFAGLGARVVGTGVLVDEHDPGLAAAVRSLPDVERRVVERAVARRRAEFVGGRTCARAVLAELGHAGAAVPRRPDRSPVWPDLITGSISHTDGWCVAVASGDQGLTVGIDVEVVGRVGDRVAPVVLGPDERAWIARSADPAHAATAVFAAKEAFYKAQHQQTASWVDFADVVVLPAGDAPDPDRLELHRRAGPESLGGLEWPVTVHARRLSPSTGLDVVAAACVVRARGLVYEASPADV